MERFPRGRDIHAERSGPGRRNKPDPEAGEFIVRREKDEGRCSMRQW